MEQSTQVLKKGRSRRDIAIGVLFVALALLIIVPLPIAMVPRMSAPPPGAGAAGGAPGAASETVIESRKLPESGAIVPRIVPASAGPGPPGIAGRARSSARSDLAICASRLTHPASVQTI